MTVVSMSAGSARAGGKGASWTGSRPKCGRAGRISLRKLRYRIG